MLNVLKLVEPSLEYADQISSFRQEIIDKETSEDWFAGCLGLDRSENPSDWIELCQIRQDPVKCKELRHSVQSITYLAIRKSDNYLIGVIDLRYDNAHPLIEEWGNCGYSVRPSEQGKGYGTEMLKLLREKAEEFNLDNLLILCDVNNPASERIMIANDGIRIPTEDITERRYRIPVKKP